MRRVRQTGIRLPESLIAKLKREAARRRVSFNDEVRMRLQDSLENRDAPRAFDAIQEDMRIAWERYVNRLIMLDCEEELVRALAQSTDIKIVAFANTWLIHHARERELDRKWKELAQPKRSQPSPLVLTQKEFEATMRAANPCGFKKADINKKGETP
jgi:plasmid stability protein